LFVSNCIGSTDPEGATFRVNIFSLLVRTCAAFDYVVIQNRLFTVWCFWCAVTRTVTIICGDGKPVC